jgi:hypothetical protein
VHLLALLCVEVTAASSPSYCGAIDYTSSPQLVAARLTSEVFLPPQPPPPLPACVLKVFLEEEIALRSVTRSRSMSDGGGGLTPTTVARGA